MLYPMLLVLWASAVVGITMGLIFNRPSITTNVSIALVIVSFCIWLTHRGHINLAAMSVTLMLVVIMSIISFRGMGIFAHSILTFTFILVISSLILEDRFFIFITTLSVLAAGFLTFAEMNGLLTTPMSEVVSAYDFFAVAVIFVITAVFTRFFANNMKQNLYRVQKNEHELSLLNQQLQQREAETNHFLKNLQSLYEINLELSRIDSLPQLYQQAVELGRTKLGFDRLAVLLYDPQTNEVTGTFGTDEQGQTVDERFFRGPAFPYMLKMLNERPHVFVRKDEPLYFAGEEVGTGWNALTILWDGDKGIGWLATDNLVQQQPIIPYQLEILTLYGSTLGHLITLKRHEEMVNTYARELEASNQDLEQFAYAASHDLQEPLRKIQSFGERLASRYSDSLDERGQNYIARMQDAADRMQRLIEDLLTLSRLTRWVQPFADVDLTKILQEVLVDLETRIEEKQATIHAEDLPTIEADPTQMRQLLQNLLSNALKFNRPDIPPAINISSQTKTIDRVEHVAITVQDNGVGFDEKHSDQLFIAFQRLHTREEFEGTGIGLALCARIVDRHNGRITAHSPPNEGATFTVTLPVSQNEKT